ncbi:hypothetical protein ACFX5U_07575 [Sphingobacterium sp. SG20118]|uniref:hypothetical protein n=1 Tax=Sphingobacterium sp. SG20118 TaxID=3367156 RepID=UPI0037DFC607
MDKKTRQGLYDFLAYYVSFQNPENFYSFEREVENKLGRSNIMGTQEYLLDKAEKQGIEKGRLEERAKIIAEKKRIAEEKHALELKLQTILEEAHEQACQSARMMLELGVDKEKIAKATGLTIEEVENLK